MARKCERCGCTQEYIPTVQSIRFDGEDTLAVCDVCWQQFRTWWYGRERAKVVIR